MNNNPVSLRSIGESFGLLKLKDVFFLIQLQFWSEEAPQMWDEKPSASPNSPVDSQIDLNP